MTEDFKKWLCGQTVAIINNKQVVYVYDYGRWVEQHSYEQDKKKIEEVYNNIGDIND